MYLLFFFFLETHICHNFKLFFLGEKKLDRHAQRGITTPPSTPHKHRPVQLKKSIFLSEERLGKTSLTPSPGHTLYSV